MILYTKRFYGLSLMFQMFGSAIPRSLPFAVVGGIVAYALRIYCAEFLDTVWKHPFPFQAISFIAGFLVTFRANLGYQRYWEGCTNLRIMSQRLADAAVQVVTFDVGALPEDAPEETLTDAAVFRDTYLHLTSLLHATALQSLCKEENTRNFIMHNSLHHTPKEDAREEEVAAAIHAQHMGMASWQDLFILRGRVVQHASPHRRDRQRIILPVLGGVCNEESVALGALDMATNPYFKDPAEFQGFLLHNGMFAPRSASRVQTVMTWLQQCIMERRREGGLQVPAPLLTRMYQLLSDGMLGYEQCRKLSRIPFPFPHAQMVTATLLLFTLTLPIMIAAFISSPGLAAVLSAMTQVLYWGTHEVARELEDPFLIWSTTYNCLPFSSMQWSFNEDILAFAYSVKPPEATRANGLFPSLHTRMPVRRYTKPPSGSVAEGTVAHPPADSHLPGLATLSRLASIAPPGAPSRASCLSSPSYSSNTLTGGASTAPSEASFSAFIPSDTRVDASAAAGGPSGSGVCGGGGGGGGGSRRRVSARGAGSSGAAAAASVAASTVATPRMRQALPAEAAAVSAAHGGNQVSSRGGLPRAASSTNTRDIEAPLPPGMLGDHAHVPSTSAPAAPQTGLACMQTGSFMTSEAASPVMAGASVASVHTAAADAEGVHRGAVSGRGHANFADPPLNSAQIQVDMQHMDDVMGMQMHDREGCVSEGLMASGHMREASFGGSLRTPLAQSGKLRGVPGDSTVEPLGASGSLIRNKIPEASDRTDDLEGDSDVHKPLLK